MGSKFSPVVDSTYISITKQLQEEMPIADLRECITPDMVKACMSVSLYSGNYESMHKAVMQVIPPVEPDEGELIAHHVILHCLSILNILEKRNY